MRPVVYSLGKPKANLQQAINRIENMKNIKKVVLIADQPYQTKILGLVGKNLVDFGIQVHMVFSDYYMFLYAKDQILDVQRHGIQTHTQEEIFWSWQGRNPGNEMELTKFIKSWESTNCNERSIDQLEKTNNFVFANERDFFGKKITRPWQIRVLHDSLRWVDKIYETVNPDLILSIENCTLVNNLFFTKAQKHGISHIAAMNSRISTRWVIRDDFGFGMSARNKSLAERIVLDKSDSLALEQYIEEFIEREKGAYQALAHLIVSEAKRRGPIRSLGHEVIELLKVSISRMVESQRRPKFKRLEQNFFKLSIWEARGIAVRFLYSIGVSHFLDAGSILEKEKFFLWNLHYRPEGSVLTAIAGRDEIELLEFAASALPEGWSLVVKEHPLMFGYREVGFYSRLKSNGSIKLVSPFVETKLLLRSAFGAVGVAGTFLLESEILGKPSWAMGHPEFEPFLGGSGQDGVESFFRRVAKGEYSNYASRIKNYLAYIFANSSKDDSWLGDHFSYIEEQDLLHNINRLTREVTRRLAQNSKTPTSVNWQGDSRYVF
jgi:hypothetical protein